MADNQQNINFDELAKQWNAHNDKGKALDDKFDAYMSPDRESMTKLKEYTAELTKQRQIMADMHKTEDERKAAAEAASKIQEQRVELLKRAKEYADAELSSKIEMMDGLSAQLQTQLQLVAAQKEAAVTDEERNAALAEELKLTNQLGEAEKKANNMRSTMQKSRTANAPLKEKMSELSSRQKKRKSDHDTNKQSLEDDLAELKRQKSAGKLTDEEYETKRTERKTKFDKAEEKSKKETGIDDPEKGMGALGAIAGAGGGIGDLIGSISGILDMVDVVKAALSGNPLGLIITIIQKIISLVKAGFEKIGEGIELYASTQEEYLAKVNTRLVGTGQTFETLTKYFSSIFGANPYVSQKALIEKMGELVDAGVAYNLEQRTILSSLSDRMVSTFDMLDETLTRLTKLQQADLSVAELGTQSLLTQLLNSMFQDSSYMSDMYDSVASSLTEALSQMNAKDATAFNYAVQKWLGALYSVGMDEGVTTIAEGINALATGDVDYFNGNDSARTLFAMATGGSYADLLVNGLNANNVNDLLNNIVTYLAQISTDTNQVTKKVKAGIFGDMSLSDIRSVANLTVSDIATLNSSNVSWSSAVGYTAGTLMNQAQENTTEAMKVENVIENTLYNIGETIVTDSYDFLGKSINKYLVWKIGDTVGGTLGTIAQAVVAGSSIGDIIHSVADSLKGIKNITQLTDENGNNLVSQMVSDAVLIKSRGASYAGTTGITRGISSSTGMSISGEIDSTLGASFAENASTVSNQTYTGASGTITRDVNDVYYKLFEDQAILRVSLAAVETQAQQDLTNEVYRVNENKIVSVIDDIKDVKTSISSKLSEIFNRQKTDMVGL